MTRREHNVEDVHDGTGRWLLQTEEYLRWSPRPAEGTEVKNSEDEAPWKHRLLWIIGNAGAGKSSLMKMAVDDAKDNYEAALVLPHFFNARGSKLEKSTEGMYRTLICWLLEELPRHAIDELKSTLGPVMPTDWGIPQLARLLKAAVKKLSDRPIMFFIDALDECKKDEVHGMLRVFRDLVKAGLRSGRQQVYVCFASRPYPHFGFHDAAFLDLSTQEEHNRDIAIYIQDELHLGNHAYAQRLRGRVQEKAQGIFMWVMLVVGMLNDDYIRGNISELERRLEDIPSGLHELYRFTLDRYPGDIDLLLLCFQWLLFAHEKLDGYTLWWGVQLGLGRKDEDICRAYKTMSLEDMERWILNVCKGLVEFRYGAFQFVHESVRDFIFKDGQLQRLYHAQHREDFEGQSQEQLRDWCVREYMARRPKFLQLIVRKGPRDIRSTDLPWLGWRNIESEQRVRFPAASYAVEGMFRHAEEAQRSGRDQTSFLQYLTQQLDSLFCDSTLRYASGGARVPVVRSLIVVLVAGGCPALIRGTQVQPARQARQAGQLFGLVDEFSTLSPITVASFVAGALAGLKELVAIYLLLDKEARTDQLQMILQQIADTWTAWRDVDPMRFYYLYGHPLLYTGWVSPGLSAFFLLVTTLPSALRPHLDAVEHILTNTPSGTLRFLMILQLVVGYRLPCDIVDYRRLILLKGLMRGTNISTSTASSENVEELEAIRQLCALISTSLRCSLQPHEIHLPESSDDEDQHSDTCSGSSDRSEPDST
jgi:hypothetical protein